jgi:DNA-binding MarR family transcriptional regulator
MPRDRVDDLQAQWAREMPDLDTGPTALLGRIYRIARLVAPTIEATMARFGLDRGEFDVLATLRRQGAPFCMTPTALYQSLLISSGSLTHRLKRLESAGLIERVASSTDGRSLEVRLPARGRRLIEQAIRADMQAERALMQGLDARTEAELVRLLRQATLLIEARLASTSADGPAPNPSE